MKTNLFKILAVFFALGVFAISSCNKPDPDQQSAEDDARGGYMMADAFALGNDNAGDTGGGKASFPEGMDVQRDLETHTVTITFTNCDYRGAVRNGVVKVHYARQDAGLRAFNITITFENYTMDGVALEGTINTTFGGTYLKPAIHVVATDMKATFTDGKVLTWSSDKTFTIEEGFANPEIDNVVVMSGTATGVNRAGKNFSSTYTNVKVKRECESKYPVSGTVSIESDNGTTVIDYGNGECDNIISVTNNGVTIEVTLD